MTYARLNQEVGYFTVAEKALAEVKSLLTADSDLYYWGKYYHVQAKNHVRSLYQQKALELYTEAIAFLKQAPTS